jgi:hypothetical protein
VDAVFDAAGKGVLADAIALAGGPERVITLSDPAAADFGVTLSQPTSDRAPGALDKTMPLLADGRLRLRAHKSMPMREAADAVLFGLGLASLGSAAASRFGAAG